MRTSNTSGPRRIVRLWPRSSDHPQAQRWSASWWIYGESKASCRNAGLDFGYCLCHRFYPLVALAVYAYGHRFGFDLFLADDEHRVHLGNLGIPDFCPDLVTGAIPVRADAGSLQVAANPLSIFSLLLADGEYTHLFGRKPQGKIAREMLNENSHKALKTAKGRAVDHYRLVRSVV